MATDWSKSDIVKVMSVVDSINLCMTGNPLGVKLIQCPRVS